MKHTPPNRPRNSVLLATTATITLTLTGLTTAPANAADATGADLVPDNNYRTCLAGYTAAAPDALTADDLHGITETVSCYSWDIKRIEGTQHLTSLTSLYLNGNQIEGLPAGVFNGLTSLTYLNLSANQIAELPAGVFNGLTNLTGLNLNDNQIAELPAGVFNGLTNLIGLTLYDNRIAELPAGVFNGLTRLIGLDLGANQIAELPAGVFNGLTRLTSLGLNGNQIAELPAGVFNGLTSLTGLYLWGNRLLDVSGVPIVNSLLLGGQTLSVVVAPDHPVRVAIRNTSGNAPSGTVDGAGGAARWADDQVSWTSTDLQVTSDTISFGTGVLGGGGGFTVDLTVVRGSAVTYRSNGGAGQAPQAQIAVPGGQVEVLANPFTNTGYTFTGWNTQADGDGDWYAPGDEFTLGQANTVLYAQWNQHGVAVTGLGVVGRPLTGTLTGWAEDTVVNVEWVVSDHPEGTGHTTIDGTAGQVTMPATSTFTPTSALIGRYVAITAAAGDETPIVSRFVLIEPLPAGTVEVIGTGVAGQPLTATPHGWPDGTTFTYQWITTPDTPIAGATNATFTPTANLAGTQVAVILTPTSADFGGISVTSQPVTITAPEPAPSPTATGSGGRLPVTGADAAAGILGTAGLIGLAGGAALLRTRRQ